MFEYNSQGSKIVDGIQKFNENSDCVWVVYPPGAAGDLVASIINFHYAHTGSKFLGITETGKVTFLPSDGEKSNPHKQNITFDSKFFEEINEHMKVNHVFIFNLDKFIIANHFVREHEVQKVLDKFPNSKIIRITPKTEFEMSVIEWFKIAKNQNEFTEVPVIGESKSLKWDNLVDDRLLEIPFSDLINSHRFERVYDSIVSHLDLNIKLIRFDFVEYWLSRQHSAIQPALRFLSQ